MKPENIYIVSNRLPVTVVRTAGGFEIAPSSGGLATALQSVFQQQNSYWIGWPGIILENHEEELQIIELLRPMGFIPVFLSRDEFDGYYNGFSNAILWPLFHYHPGHCLFDPEYWLAYSSVNKKFAAAITKNVPLSDFVWIHDYQLMLVSNDVGHEHLSYFHHIHFPAAEVFGIIPWRTDLLEALLKCRHIVFQTEKDCKNFKQACKLYAENNTKDAKQATYTKITHHPISIDAFTFSNTADKPVVQSKIQDIKKVFKNQQIILSVDRLDYSKGILERLEAFSQLLNDHPKYCENVVLVMLVVPSRFDVPSYEEHKKKVDELVGNINSKYSTLNWRPVHYYYQQMDRETLCAYYAASDFCLITSLRDGLNLVSKEYVACRNNNDGVLILSEMTGAANELKYALKVHPYDIRQMVSSIVYALEMDKSEAKLRMEALRSQVFGYTVFDWLNRIFQEVFCLYDDLNYSYEQNLNSEVIANLSARFRQASQRYLLLDYDGCIRELETHPGKAVPPRELIDLLCRLNALDDTEVVLVSGRSRTDMEKWFGHCGITLIAEHGAWFKKSYNSWIPFSKDIKQHKTDIFTFLNKYAQHAEGVYLEEKEVGYCLHYKMCAEKDIKRLMAEIEADYQKHIKANNLPYRYLMSGEQFEIMPEICNKGSVIQKNYLFKTGDFILAAGDDDTDEDLFAILPKTTFTFKIGKKKTKAKIRIAEVERFVDFLSRLENSSVLLK